MFDRSLTCGALTTPGAFGKLRGSRRGCDAIALGGAVLISGSCAQLAGFEDYRGDEEALGSPGTDAGASDLGQPSEPSTTLVPFDHDAAEPSEGVAAEPSESVAAKPSVPAPVPFDDAGAGSSGGAPPTGVGGSAGSADPTDTGGRGLDCDETELLIDGDFDGAEGVWLEGSDFSPPIDLIRDQSDPEVTSYGVVAESPAKLLWMGTRQHEFSHVTQTVRVPEDAIELRASGVIRVITTQPPEDWGDEAEVHLLHSPDATDFDVVLEWATEDVNDAWTHFEATVDAAPYRGETVVVRIACLAARSDQTRYGFDSLSLIASRCGR